MLESSKRERKKSTGTVYIQTDVGDETVRR